MTPAAWAPSKQVANSRRSRSRPWRRMKSRAAANWLSMRVRLEATEPGRLEQIGRCGPCQAPALATQMCLVGVPGQAGHEGQRRSAAGDPPGRLDPQHRLQHLGSVAHGGAAWKPRTRWPPSFAPSPAATGGHSPQTARTMSRSTGLAAGAHEGRLKPFAGNLHNRLGASACGTAGSELGQLGGRCHDSLHVRAEVDDQGDSRFDTLYCAETVLVVSDHLIYGEGLGRRLGIAQVEGTGCEMALADGAGLAHYLQYAAWGRRASLPPARLSNPGPVLAGARGDRPAGLGGQAAP